jgi:hypothetical protein
MAVIDSYSESNQSSGLTLGAAGYSAAGQSLTASARLMISDAQFYLKKTGSPTGNISARILTHTGTYGNTSIPDTLIVSSSTVVAASSLTTSYQLISFNFPSGYVLDNGGYYCAEVVYSGGDISNNVSAGADVSSPSHSGNAFINSGGYADANSFDLIFYLNGTTPPPYITGLSSITGINYIKF